MLRLPIHQKLRRWHEPTHPVAMLERIGRRSAKLFEATAPDPWVLAVALTFVTFLLALIGADASFAQVFEIWGSRKGIWSLLQFSMQMALILVTGYALALAPPMAQAIERLAALPRTSRQAVVTVSVTAMACALVNWGLGLIVGALVARAVGDSCARREVPFHYPLLVAAGYTGLLVWHGGLSGTAPLMMTHAEDVTTFLGPALAKRTGVLSYEDTVFSGFNFLVTGGLLFIVPVALAAMTPRVPAKQSLPQAKQQWAPMDQSPAVARSLPQRLEHTRALGIALGLACAVAAATRLATQGIDRLDPNLLNLMFLAAGLMVHGTLYRYAKAAGFATAAAAGIVLQFPFYAGIMGVARHTGLAAHMASQLSQSVAAGLVPAATCVSAAIVNLFVPSGGGQWAIQGPIAVAAAHDAGASVELTVMAVAYGDQLTNMLQPFWALPLLAITGIEARNILGYTALLMLVAAAWIFACLIVLSL